MKQVLMAAILLYAGSMAAQNRKISFDSATLGQSLEKAKNEHKLVFVDCVTSWCGPCKEMSKYVFTKDTVADYFNAHFVNVQLDMEKGEGPAIGKEFHVEAYPTYLLLNSNRKIIYRFVGGMPADTFLAKISRGSDTLNRVATLNERYNNGERTKELIREYIQVKIDGMEISLGEQGAVDYFNMLTPKERVAPENWFLFGENRYSLYFSNIHSVTFSYLADHWADFAKTNGKEAVENKLRHMYQRIAEHSLHGWYLKDRQGNHIPYNKKDFDQYRAQLNSTKLSDKDQLIAMMYMSQAALEKDTNRLTALMIKHIGQFSADNQRAMITYFNFFPYSERKKNPGLQQVIDAIIQSNKNESLIRFVKSLKA